LSSSDHKLLLTVSKDFIDRFEVSNDTWLWMLLRFAEDVIAWPPVRISDDYAEDCKVLKCVRKSLREASKKQNSDKILIFDTMQQSRFVVESDLTTIAAKQSIQTFKRLEAFLHIYRMESIIAFSFVPFLEMIDELETIMGRFQKGEDDTTLLEPMRCLLRRVKRRKVLAEATAILGLLSLYLLTPAEQLLQFVINTAIWGSIALIALGIYSTSKTWWSFTPLLSEAPVEEIVPRDRAENEEAEWRA
jgi:hypothetical protein